MKYKPVHHKCKDNPKLECWGWYGSGDIVHENRLPYQVYVLLWGNDHKLSQYYNHKVYKTEKEAMDSFKDANNSLLCAFLDLADDGYYDGDLPKIYEELYINRSGT